MTAMQVEDVPLDRLSLHPKNPRQGDVGAITLSIERFGLYQPIVAQLSTGNIIAGNHRYKAEAARGAETIPVIWADVTDQEAEAMMLADNRTADLATYDEGELAELLQRLAAEDSLLGTGYDEDDLDALVRRLDSLSEAPSDPYEEWEQSMPEYRTGDYSSVFHVTIHFKSDEDAEAFFAMLGRVKPGTKSMWWPEPNDHKTSDFKSEMVADDEG